MSEDANLGDGSLEITEEKLILHVIGLRDRSNLKIA